MSSTNEKLTGENQVRVTVIELYISGAIGNAIYLHHIDPTDTDEAIKSAVEDRFPGSVTLRNYNTNYSGDIQRLIASYLIGSHTSLLTISLRTFGGQNVKDHSVVLTIYWTNLPDNVRMPDFLVFHDCNEFDCDTITRQVVNIQPLTRPENPGAVGEPSKTL